MKATEKLEIMTFVVQQKVVAPKVAMEARRLKASLGVCTIKHFTAVIFSDNKLECLSKFVISTRVYWH
jgi:hypothetical protein